MLKKWLLPRHRKVFLGISTGLWAVFLAFGIFITGTNTLFFSTPQGAYRFRQLPFSSSPEFILEGEDSAFLLTENLTSSGVVLKRGGRYRIYSVSKVQEYSYRHDSLKGTIVYLSRLEESQDYYIIIRGISHDVAAVADNRGTVFYKATHADKCAWYGLTREPSEDYTLFIDEAPISFCDLELIPRLSDKINHAK